MIRLLGNIPVASKYLTWAKHKLTYIKRMLAIFDDQHLFSHWYKFPDANVFINTCNGMDYISIWGMIGGALIIAQPGTSTTDFTTRRYYDIFGNDLQIPSGQKPAGWTLLDDGTYGFEGSVSNDDPETNSYAYPSTDKGSMLVPAVFNGIAATFQLGNQNYRFVLNDSQEDEMWEASEVEFEMEDTSTFTSQFLTHDDSLIYTPYRYRANKPFLSRYVADGIITATQMWSAFETVLVYRAYYSGDWVDCVPQITRIYYKPFQQTSQNARRYTTITPAAVCLAMTQFYSDNRLTQDVIRGNDWLYTPNGAIGYITAGMVFEWGAQTSEGGPEQMLEPSHQETYDLSTLLNPVVVGKEFDRGIDESLYSCFFIDGDTISGKTLPTLTRIIGGYPYSGPAQSVSDTGIETIKDDVIKPYALKQDGTMTYVRCQKTQVSTPRTAMDANDNLFTQNVNIFTTWNCGLYVAGKLIEESGFLPVIELYDDTILPPQPGTGDTLEFNYYLQEIGGCPIYILPVTYKILHAHHDANFDVCIYRKTVYKSYEQAWQSYYANRDPYQYPGFGGGSAQPYQFRKTTIDSVTTYWIVVNGVISQITYKDSQGNIQPYQSTNHEKQLTLSGNPLSINGVPIGATNGMQEVDGYSQAGIAPWVDIDAGSVNITRIFTTASSKHILIGFDVFPVQVNHNLTYFAQGGDTNLLAEFDTTVPFPITPFPPSSDGTYPSVQDRQWILFDASGNGSQIQTPTVNNDGKTKVNRVNGLCLLET